MKHLYLILIIVFFSVINFNLVESFTNHYYLGQPTKCFSCEKQMPTEKKYLSGPTKCFSCERDLIRRYGTKYADLAQPSKCFSCERQYGKMPF